ncbi:zinc-dependent metalloprotease [Neolewinella antarctica]|uniref:Peptidase n=1 Tax=Neolewinella antarctica TaxID=442734 RepID=A0ABX0XFB1_9BACT|nr:zinc-dependent metalloprotease [Neolewinella antarctica]NJC27569.1 hypothetical protein [Neolewinella antarctica]
MILPRTLLLGFLAIFLCTGVSAQKADAKKMKSIAEVTDSLEKMEGYFDFYWSDEEGKVYLEVKNFDEDFLYVNSLAAGLGSNDIGLDRNQLGDSRVVQFRRVGPKVLLVQRNLDYRAVSDNPDEVASVRDAFAQSVLFGFKAAAMSDGRALIDLTPMLLSDAHGVIDRLKKGKQGTFKLDADRSAVYRAKTKNFPQNSEFEATLTFTGEATGSQLRSVTPTSGSFSLRMHHSFVELPDDGYQARVFDPRSGYFPMMYADYATPIDQPLHKRFITRHRLEKKDPTLEMSDPVEPIIYYLDRGAPEPVKTALLEGARWWNEAFEEAGYRNAFRVEVLPEDADPLDVRYNVINWVHRSSRGWSYGSSVVDPRTGEIIKGHVLLGSLRVRQDFLLAQGLIPAYAEGSTPDPRLEEMALARLRQLSAHEVGHTIGLAHNFAASVNERTSVMDYPHPYVTLENGVVDLSEAYAVGIGEWDVRTVLYGYQDFTEGVSEKEELAEILEENDRLSLLYLSDADARPAGSSNPQAHLWDNGGNAVDELDRLLELRAFALKNFGPDNLAPDLPISELEKVLTPVYLMHRYQVEAVAKSVAGYYYQYETNSAYETAGLKPVDDDEQRRAVKGLLRTLSPDVLRLPATIYRTIPPPAMGYDRDRELFKTKNGGGLDPFAMAELAADNTLMFMLHPQRLDRVAEQRALYPKMGFTTLPKYLKRIWTSTNADPVDKTERPYAAALNAMVQRRYVEHLMRVATDATAAEMVRAATMNELRRISKSLNGEEMQRTYLDNRIKLFLRNPGELKLPPAGNLPDGSPIGCGH